jgi:hypothetical protein
MHFRLQMLCGKDPERACCADRLDPSYNERFTSKMIKRVIRLIFSHNRQNLKKDEKQGYHLRSDYDKKKTTIIRTKGMRLNDIDEFDRLLL